MFSLQPPFFFFPTSIVTPVDGFGCRCERDQYALWLGHVNYDDELSLIEWCFRPRKPKHYFECHSYIAFYSLFKRCIARPAYYRMNSRSKLFVTAIEDAVVVVVVFSNLLSFLFFSMCYIAYSLIFPKYVANIVADFVRTFLWQRVECAMWSIYIGIMYVHLSFYLWM